MHEMFGVAVRPMSDHPFSQHARPQPVDAADLPWPGGRPSRIGVLSNPLSGGNRDGLGRIHQVVRRHPDVVHLEACQPEEVNAALDAFAADGIDLIAVNGGDGTVQAVLTGLFDRRPFRSMPALALLYGGTSNMLPKDFGLKGPQHVVLGRILKRLKADSLPVSFVSRPVLKVDAAGQRPLYGMFFGAGVVYRGIQFFHSKVHTLGFSGELAHAIVVARLLGALLSRKSTLVAPQAVRAQLSAGALPEEAYLVLLVSSLEKLILGLRPYWGSGPGPLHLTAVTARPKRLFRAIAGFFSGASNRCLSPENGYHSHEVEAARLRFQGGFTLDGELYQSAAPDGTVHITTGGHVLFMCSYG